MMAFLAKHAQNALLAAVVASVMAVIASFSRVYLTYTYGSYAQEKQAKLEALAKFEQSSSSLVEIGGAFIFAINTAGDLSLPKDKIRAFAMSQIGEAENLRKFFAEDEALTKYQDALHQFSEVATATSNPSEIKQWVESLGGVIDSKTVLSKDLYSQLGVSI